ncbi:hypothetical protein C8R41DRAFT_783209 [Lentinula lateritia]|uniref:Uncharacterized protein n=1 Tax=Lentinula lateritia TaxID=40482 RepID=A0ABQ8UWL6_9AGAR|nr:hypothetical protein C8R41DRAFT_783209 [Lentinula lateritia]
MGLNFYNHLGAPQSFDTLRAYVTSPWFPSMTLAAIRGMIALYTLATLLVILIWQATVLHDADGCIFSYFTELTHIGICSYYWASFTQTFCYALRQRHSIERTPEYPLQRWPRIFQLLHVMLGTTIISYPILVTIVFWALLASPAVFSTKFGTWSNISIHVLNTAWSLFEMIGTNTPPPRWSMLPCMIIILALYLALAYVTHATQGFYPYSFLNPSTSHSLLAGYIIGIAIAACIVFTLAKTIMWARTRFAFKNASATPFEIRELQNSRSQSPALEMAESLKSEKLV